MSGAEPATSERPPRWRRWYTIIGIGVAATIGLALTVGPTIGYRGFYIPSEAMMPTLLKDDKVLGLMMSFDAAQSGSRPLRRGDIILFNVGEHVYIKRLAALPGDRIELIEGLVYLNGRPVPQRFVRQDPIENHMYGNGARRLRERFPGEAQPHEIYDLGYSPGDDFAQLRVPEGHVFVLGDNRDSSADSRFSRDQLGVALLPISDIIGVADRIYWRPGDGIVNIPLTN